MGRFEFDSSFVSPRARPELRDLATLREMFPGSPLSLFGHTDPTGDDQYNKALSGRRALALHAVLTRDAEGWEDLWNTPLPGDSWGTSVVQSILGSLPGGDMPPYYGGPVDGAWSSSLSAALQAFQSEHPATDGSPLAVDGQLGPQSRRAMFTAYMEWLCTWPDGVTLRLSDEDFLARGRDPQRRGDVQGCGEFNPRMVFSKDEAQAYASWDAKQERDEENSVNRRVVAYLYEPGTEVDPDTWWPCPAARQGLPACQQRLWSDQSLRRNPSERRRHFDGDFDTFGCRFYHYFALDTPAETPIHLTRTFDLYLHDGGGLPPITGTFRLASSDGEIVQIGSDADAIVLREDPSGRVRCLSFTGLPGAKTWSLSSLDADPKTHKSLVMLENFTLEQFAAQGLHHDPEQQAQTIEFVAIEPDHGEEPSAIEGTIDWDAAHHDWYGAR